MSRLTLDLSPEVSKKLEEIAKSERITKSEAMRRAFALLALLEAEKKKGNSLGIVKESKDDPNQYEVLARVVGA